MKREIELQIKGMTCDHCAMHVSKAIKGVKHVADALVPDWSKGYAKVIADEKVSLDDVKRAVADAGYSVAGYSLLKDETVKGIGGFGKRDTDLMVIGGGSAGFAAAIRGADLGYRVSIVEESVIGGTCVNIGCVPSKTLIKAMSAHYTSMHPNFKGIKTGWHELSWEDIVDEKNKLVKSLRRAKYIDVLKAYPEIKLIEGKALLKGGNRVEINGEFYEPGKIILALGAKPWVPPIAGLADVDYLDSTTAMDLKKLPHSLIVIGANAVGLELAQVFCRAGVEVTVIEIKKRIAPGEDSDVSDALLKYLTEEGVKFITGADVQRVSEEGDSVKVEYSLNGKGYNISSGRILVATGRRPSTAGLGLKSAGIKTNAAGGIVVSEYMQTTNPEVYAAGDVIDKEMFVYTAAYGGGIAAENALKGNKLKYDSTVLPRVIFTEPQAASVGISEEEAEAAGYSYRVSYLPMNQVPIALASRDTKGFIKLIENTETEKIIGAHIVAQDAGNIIQTAVMAVKFGLTAADIRNTFFPYLTGVEGLKLAVLTFDREVSKLSCCAV